MASPRASSAISTARPATVWIEGSSEQSYGVMGDACQGGARARGCGSLEGPEARRQRVRAQIRAEVAPLISAPKPRRPSRRT